MVAQTTAEALPLADGVAELVTAIWISTDVHDIAAVVREARRVLSPGGLLVIYGVHPCFNGPGVERREDGTLVVHPVYRDAGWHAPASWWGPSALRARVGMRHVPLAELLGAVLGSGLRLTRVVEPRDDPIPAVLALVAVLEPT